MTFDDIKGSMDVVTTEALCGIPSGTKGKISFTDQKLPPYGVSEETVSVRVGNGGSLYYRPDQLAAA